MRDSDNMTLIAVVGLIAAVIVSIAVCVTVVNVSEQRQEIKMAELGFTPADVNYSNTWVKLEESE